jgi:chitodextrinase
MFRRFLDATDYWFGCSDDSSTGSYDPARARGHVPTSQAEPEAPAAEATLLEASIVEGKYSAEVEVPSRVVVVAMLTDTLVFFVDRC